MKLLAVLDNLEKIIQYAVSCARSHGIPEKSISDIHLAVDEACTNIINYAYPAGREGEIEIRCRREGGKFLITIRDWGEPFNPLQAPAPDLQLDLDRRPVGGLGIFLMKKFSDELHYHREDSSNLLFIVKYV